ncbi:MAG: aspartate/glutamate racemase family protein, partial [Rhodospirillales bacterium]|nr:aspartate/glutamate racemase family protein [Rhodospirillales bacterium]
ALALPDIVRIVRDAAGKYDAIVITCFYDLGLREAREISGRTVVTAPCQSALAIASQLGNTFSILVGRRKWIPKMSEAVRLYGQDHALASMRPVDLGVLDFNSHAEARQRLMDVGRRCVEEDGAEVLILGCGALYDFPLQMQEELGVPVIGALQAAFKYGEFLADTARRLGWYPSRKWGSEAPPEEDISAWGLFDQPAPVGQIVHARAGGDKPAIVKPAAVKRASG